MGNCFRGSSSDEFTRLGHEEANVAHQTAAVRLSEPPPSFFGRVGHQGLTNTIHVPVFQRRSSQLSEDEQVKMAQRIGLIQHLPTGLYYDDESSKKGRECAICMIEFEVGDQMRFLPCLHAYHKDCIDSWLVRSFTCPSCMEPVDAALLMSFD